eukprot:gene8860-9039_t
MESAALNPFPLLSLPDLVLQHVLTFLSLLERKAVRGSCRKLCKVASAAVRHFHVEKAPGDSYLEYLSLHDKFPNTQVVSLSDELVADRPFASLVTLTLCKLKNLICLLLLNTSMSLSAAGLAALSQCRHIKQLVLAAPFISKGPLMAANTQAISTILSQLPGLTHLLLLPNQQQDTGGGAAATAAAAVGLGQGQAAALNGRARDWQLNDAALRSLGALHGLVQLEFGCDPVGLSDLNSLLLLSNLRRLALRGLSLEAGERLGVLTGLPALRSLSLADGGIGEDSLVHVGRCSRLTRLELQGCPRLREVGLGHLTNLHSLSCFRAFTGHCSLIRLALACEATSDAGLAAVSSLTRLRELTLCGGPAVSPQRLISVVQHLPHLQLIAGLATLRQLQRTFIGLMSLKLLKALGAMPAGSEALAALQLSHMKNLSDESLAQLVASARGLALLGLQEPGRVTSQGFALLGAMHQLSILWVDCCKLSIPVLMALAIHPSLQMLEVHQSHPESETLGLKQLELLRRVKGPQLEVVLREGARSRQEVLMLPALQMLAGTAPGSSCSRNRDASSSSESACRSHGWESLGSEAAPAVAMPAAGSEWGFAAGYGSQELVLDHGLMVGGSGARLISAGSGLLAVDGLANAVQNHEHGWPNVAGVLKDRSGTQAPADWATTDAASSCDPNIRAMDSFLSSFLELGNAFIEKQVSKRAPGKSEVTYQPSKLEHLYGCALCNHSEVGCKACWDAPFATRPASRAKPEEYHWQRDLPDAPTFRPTTEEFSDPFAYLASIAPEASKAGIALIIPPASWQPPIQMLDQESGQLRKDFKETEQPKEAILNPAHLDAVATAAAATDGQFGYEHLEEPLSLFDFHRGVQGKFVPGTAAAAAGGAGGGGKSSREAAADWQEPDILEVEAEFWRIVEAANEQVEALYGQDVDTATYRSAFPTIRLCNLRAYTGHPWNINNLPQAPGSVLRFVREDVGGKPITGLMVPWLYVGSCFSAFCWHIEDHGLYSVNYNHMGAPKVWYGVPAMAAAALDAAMRDALPHLFEKDKLLLHKLITMLSPNQLRARGVPVCRAVQVPGSFIVTFPDAYHSGFNSGFNVAEAVNFAAPDWLPFGSSSVVRYRWVLLLLLLVPPLTAWHPC